MPREAMGLGSAGHQAETHLHDFFATPQSAIEHASGGQVVQYRNRILPLVPLRDVLEAGATGQDQGSDPIQVVVFNDGERSVGLVVDQILGVAEEAVTVRQKSARKGLLGSAVVASESRISWISTT